MTVSTPEKPEIFNGDLKNLPQALEPLMGQRRWVGWKLVWSPEREKWIKPPLQLNGRNASVSDPETWFSYDEIVEGEFDGIGIVLTKEDKYVGGDLDGVVDPVTGDLEPWVQEIIELGETYAEISPSGTGVRMFFRGKLDRPIKNDKMKVEVYASGRYLTVTGNKIPGCPDEIREAPKTLAALKARVAGAKPKSTNGAATDGVPEHLRGYKSTGIGADLPKEEPGPWDKLKEDALANPEKWIFELFGSDGPRLQADGSYRVGKKTLGRELVEDIAIHHDHAFDYGEADQPGEKWGGVRSAIDLAMEWSEPKKTFNEAVAWLRGKLYGDVGPGTSGSEATNSSYLMSSKKFIASFVAPDYLIKNMLMTSCIYSFTAPTGTGKTAVMMRIAAHVAVGLPVAGKRVKKGRVLYFAGENPVDIRMRWIKLCEAMALDGDHIDVHFLDGARPIFTPEFKNDLDAYLEEIGEIILLIIDTSMAYFTGDDDNNNVQAKNHAVAMRAFTEVKGKPTVVVNCHPVKNPDMSNLLPKGGGNFVNEVDGNLVGIGERGSKLIEIDTHGKFRGPDFPPFSFKIIQATSEKLKDSEGDPLWTVYAEPISDAEKAVIDEARHDRKTELLRVIAKHPEASLADLAEALGWRTLNGEVNRNLVNSVLRGLKAENKITVDGNRRKLTAKGRKALEETGTGPGIEEEDEAF